MGKEKLVNLYIYYMVLSCKSDKSCSLNAYLHQQIIAAAKSWLAGEEQEYGKLDQRVKGSEVYDEQLRQHIISIHDSLSMTPEQKKQAIQRLIHKRENGTIRTLCTDNIITEEQYTKWQKKLVG